MNSGNGAVLERAKPAGARVKKGVQTTLRKISYDPNPRRTKFMLIAKAALPALFAGMIIGRRRSIS